MLDCQVKTTSSLQMSVLPFMPRAQKREAERLPGAVGTGPPAAAVGVGALAGVGGAGYSGSRSVLPDTMAFLPNTQQVPPAGLATIQKFPAVYLPTMMNAEPGFNVATTL